MELFTDAHFWVGVALLIFVGVLVYAGVPKLVAGALDARATEISESMKLAAAEAIAMAVSSDDLGPGFIIPSVFDRRVVELVAPAVAEAARADGVVRA